MKISSIIILAVLLGFIIWRITAFLLERRRQKIADKEGVVVYATFVSSEPIKFFGRPQTDVEKITLRVQEPGSTEEIPGLLDDRVRDRILAALPERYGRILELRFLQSYSLREAARAMNVSAAGRRASP